MRTWTLYTDGSTNVKGGGLGICLISPSGEIVKQAIKYDPITNNEVEYEAVIAGLELTKGMGIDQIEIKSDSQLVINQIQGNYVAREILQQYLEKVQNLLHQFRVWKAIHITREENAEIDALANLGSLAHGSKYRKCNHGEFIPLTSRSN
ncbi:uncharacterized protein LOC142168942 [Nicotiana tabacum]|uniref:Uncharacterized protein LOC142168942 n=1 Tax=Nicotiana tabacum TaxID=4097 RepID=A0AC58SML6_TOBAC